MDSEVRYFPVEDRYRRPDNRSLCHLSSDICPLEVGFPIRISADQSSFAAPHGFSQRSTSFIACAYQGIHRTPFIHSITLITNARPATERHGKSGPKTLGRVLEARPPASNGTQAFRPSQAPKGARKRSGKNQCHTRIFRVANPGQSPKPTTRTTLLFTMSANRRPPGQMPKSRKLCSSTSLLRRPAQKWWSQTGSNRRPHACKARALPTELWPLLG